MDLAESVDDLICTFDGLGDTTMDTLAMFIFGWILAALFLLWLGKIIYNKYILKIDLKNKQQQENVKIEDVKKTQSDVVDTSSSSPSLISKTSAVKNVSASSTSAGIRGGSRGGGSGGYVPPTPPVRKRITRQSPGPDLNRKQKYVPAPQCTGPDKISVLWVNDFFQWLYNDLEMVNEFINVWIANMNSYTQKASNDVSLIKIDFSNTKRTVTNRNINSNIEIEICNAL